MWYFSWILGVGVALSFGIINVMWLESHRPAEVVAKRQARLTGLTSGAVSWQASHMRAVNERAAPKGAALSCACLTDTRERSMPLPCHRYHAGCGAVAPVAPAAGRRADNCCA